MGRKKDCIRCAGDGDSPPAWGMEYNSDDANESRFGAVHDAALQKMDKQRAKELGRQARRLLGGLPAEDYTFALIGDDNDDGLQLSDDARKLKAPKPQKRPRKRTWMMRRSRSESGPSTRGSKPMMISCTRRRLPVRKMPSRAVSLWRPTANFRSSGGPGISKLAGHHLPFDCGISLP